MENKMHLWEQAEHYANRTLPAAEKQAVEEKLKNDPAFAVEFRKAIHLISTLKDKNSTEAFRKSLHEIHAQTTQPVKRNRRIIPYMPNWRVAAIAASVAAVISVGGLLGSKTAGNSSAQYRQLSRELEAVKRSQNNLVQSQKQLISEVKEVKSVKRNAPSTPANSVGTAFALNNGGYLITAYHVAKDADSLYVQTRKGDNYKATLLAFDPQADVAVLKVSDKGFRFAAGEVPYSFAPRRSGLGAQIYTLGFPQEEIVYSEGYVSAANGFGGDSSQYRLELPADPGVSGAPVLDASGNVIGIIAGRNNTLAGTTYAVTSKQLLRMLRSMPKEQQPALSTGNRLKGLSREQQLEKLQDYTCMVRVYKR